MLKLHQEADEVIQKDDKNKHQKREVSKEKLQYGSTIGKELKTEHLIKESDLSDECEEVKEAADYVLKSSRRPPPVDSYARDESIAYYNDENQQNN